MLLVMKQGQRYQASRGIILLGAGKNIVLTLTKVIAGIFGNSPALLADGIHSLSDLLIDLLVLLASRFGDKAADHDHPYGHGRIETAATVLLAFILLLAGGAIIYHAGQQIITATVVAKPSFYVLLVALFSVGINELLYFYTNRVGVRVKSKLLIANAWHHRSDSVSSLVVLIGVVAAWFGAGAFDAVAAIIVGLMIMHMAWQFGFSSVRELVDTGLDDAIVADINTLIRGVAGVRALHQLRSRSVGGAVFLDVHIQVAPLISVSEGHFIGQQVHYELIQKFTDVIDVTVHVDAEDDEKSTPSRHLPTRAALLALLAQRLANTRWQTQLDTLVLHYLAGKLQLEWRVPLAWLDAVTTAEQLTRELQDALNDQLYMGDIKLLFVL